MPNELDLYIQNQPELLKKYNGAIIALHHGEVQGVYPSKLDALNAMMERYKPGDFIVIKCTPGDSEYTRWYRSRSCRERKNLAAAL